MIYANLHSINMLFKYEDEELVTNAATNKYLFDDGPSRVVSGFQPCKWSESQYFQNNNSSLILC